MFVSMTKLALLGLLAASWSGALGTAAVVVHQNHPQQRLATTFEGRGALPSRDEFSGSFQPTIFEACSRVVTVLAVVTFVAPLGLTMFRNRVVRSVKKHRKPSSLNLSMPIPLEEQAGT